MRNSTLALLVGGLSLGTAGIAAAQDLAEAVPAPKGALMVFTEKGDRALSPTAVHAIHQAADKARAARSVTLTGSPQDVATVRAQLVRDGVPARAIVARNDAGTPLPRTRDGLSDPAERHVAITF
jgi:hypothetical protein